MFQRLFSVLLFFACLAGNVQATEWHFKYTGFTDAETQTFLPDLTLEGSFTGEDTDGNGIIAKEELTFFTIGLTGWTFLDVYCGRFDPYYHCHLNSFSYALTGQLTFNADQDFRDDVGIIGHDWRWISDDHFYISSWANVEPPYFDENTYLWTDQTRFSIVPPPVPEPAMAYLLLAGLPPLAWWRLSRRVKRPCRSTRTALHRCGLRPT